MSHFYATIQGAKGEASRTGSKQSGIYAHARGWDIGGSVEVSHDEESGTDTVVFFITKGSNNSGAKEIARATVERGVQYADAKIQLINKVLKVTDNEMP